MRMIAVIFAVFIGGVVLAQPPKDVVMLDRLVETYEPVPFDHKSHAAMAEMWNGCETCHHRSPANAAATQPVGVSTSSLPRTQANAGHMPACGECHPADATRADLYRPNLKGAYHRQCLNCHREWAGENACSACHRERKAGGGGALAKAAATRPSVDDIVGRMHPPIPEPDVRVYTARFTPAVGKLVTFRHKEHTTRYGLRCVDCHHRDTCADCHDAKAKTIARKPVAPARTWKGSHGACMSACHANDRCAHCHYDQGEAPPATFSHASTGQVLDDDHAKLACRQCHATLKSKVAVTCGDAACHKRGGIAFPVDRPGRTVSTRPAAVQLVAAPVASSQPSTRPIVRRIRWGAP